MPGEKLFTELPPFAVNADTTRFTINLDDLPLEELPASIREEILEAQEQGREIAHLRVTEGDWTEVVYQDQIETPKA